MTLQHKPNKKLPRWLSLLIVGLFVGHFMILLVYNFSEHLLPMRFRYLTSHYVLPWFHQNLDAFAPEPPMDDIRLIYRLHQDDSWSKWNDPVLTYLPAQWHNRLGYASKMHEVVMDVGAEFYMVVARSQGIVGHEEQWENHPVTLQAIRLIRASEPKLMRADSFQLAILIASHSVVNDALHTSDSLILFPTYAWHD